MPTSSRDAITTITFDKEGKETYDFENYLIENPVRAYKQLNDRLIEEGPLVPFPEFHGIVQHLIKQLKHPFVVDIANYDKNSKHVLSGALYEQYKKALITIYHVTLDIELDQKTIDEGYPHRKPYSGRYPYQPTIEAISKVLNFFDSLERTVKENMIPLYFTDRYTYYELSLKHQTDEGYFVTIPTSKPLTLRDLLSLRAAPLGFVGVSSKTIFADAYFNSPKDFWVHDFNHNRRFDSYNRRYAERNKCTLLEAYQQFEDTIKYVILPDIEITSSMSEREQNLQKMKLVLYFEFMHEFAFPPDRQYLIEALTFKADSLPPFEIMMTGTDNSKDSRRMFNTNLQSGIIGYVHESGCTTPTVKYFHDTVGPNFITSAFNKLTHSFYDSKFSTSPELPESEYRTPEIMAEAALAVMRTFAIEPSEVALDKRTLMNLACNKTEDGKKISDIEVYQHLNLRMPSLNKEVVNTVITSASIRAKDGADSDAISMGFFSKSPAIGKKIHNVCHSHRRSFSR